MAVNKIAVPRGFAADMKYVTCGGRTVVESKIAVDERKRKRQAAVHRCEGSTGREDTIKGARVV